MPVEGACLRPGGSRPEAVGAAPGASAAVAEGSLGVRHCPRTPAGHTIAAGQLSLFLATAV